MKVVINSCYGGFSLSPLAVAKLAEKKGLTLHWYKSKHDGKSFVEKPVSEQEALADTNLFGPHAYTSPTKEDGTFFDSRPENRADPDLVAVVEELGEKANGACAELTIVEIPNDVQWHVEEYDGNEHIAEDHRTWYA